MQNISLYNESLLSSWKKKARFAWIFLGIITFAALSLVIGLCFWMNDKTFIWIIVVLSLSLVLLAWSWIYLLTSLLLPLRARKRILKVLQNAKEGTFDGEIVSSSKKRTVMSFLEVWLIEIQKEGEIRSFYFDSFLGSCPFKEGMFASICTKGNFVVGYEEKHNEDASK